MVAGTVSAVLLTGSSPASANENDWYRLRVCESGDNYTINTGNGYYGAYQFNLGTWRSVGGSGYPNQASVAEQDYRARLLYRSRGWEPWECARILGLRPDPTDGYIAVAPTIHGTTAGTANSIVRLGGSATPAVPVDVFEYQVGWANYHHVATVRASGSGTWAWNTRLAHTSRFYVQASGHRSPSMATRYLFRTNIYGPPSQLVNQTYPIIGTARPSSVVTLYYSSPGHGFYPAQRVRADPHGTFRTTWRARTDYRYFATSDTRSGTGGTSVATTAQGSISVSSSGSPGASPGAAVVPNADGAQPNTGLVTVPLSGTARPSGLVWIYVAHPGQHWHAVAGAHVDAAGHWSVSLRAASSFIYFARSSNHEDSHAYQVVVR